MAKRKPIKARAAGIIREGLIDGRSDGALWGTVQHQGNDTPRWYENKWRLYASGGEPDWLGRAYYAAWEKGYKEVRDALYSKMSREERVEAKKAAELNKTLRWETRDQREMRLLRERVESAESALKEAEQRVLELQK